MVIDARVFARTAGALSGHLAAASCWRLCQGLPAQQPGVFDWQLMGRADGGRGASAQLWLDVLATGHVRVVCQRCLAEFDLELRVSDRLGLVDDAAQLEAMDALETKGQGSDVEYLVAESALDVESLIEDELILVLPVAPWHEVCPGGAGAFHDQEGAPASPFAVLAQLKKH